MLPWSVIPRAGCPSATAAWTRSLTRAAPSSIENSVWVCRWVNDRVANGLLPSSDGGCRDAVSPGVLHRVWTSYSQCHSDDSATGRPGGPIRGWSAQGGSEIGARAAHVLGWRLGEGSLAHLVQLGPGRHLLGHQDSLVAVEQALQPPDQLGVGDPELGIRGGVASNGMEPGPARRPGRGETVRQRGSTARRSRGGGLGWPRPAGPGGPPPAAA